jgi:Protein of unknown function (DUF2934)
VNRVARTKTGSYVAAKGGEGQSDASNPALVPAEDEIRQRAYAIHLDRGGQHGYDLDDWLRAEQELRQEKRASPGT